MDEHGPTESEGMYWRGHGSYSLEGVLQSGAVEPPRPEWIPLTGEIHITNRINTLDIGDGGMVCFTPSDGFAHLYALKESNADPSLVGAAFDQLFPNEPDLSHLRTFFVERSFMAPESRKEIVKTIRQTRHLIKKCENSIEKSENPDQRMIFQNRLNTLNQRLLILQHILERVEKDHRVQAELKAIRRQFPALLGFDGIGKRLKRMPLRYIPEKHGALEWGHKGPLPIRPHLKEVHVPTAVIPRVRIMIENLGLHHVNLRELDTHRFTGGKRH